MDSLFDIESLIENSAKDVELCQKMIELFEDELLRSYELLSASYDTKSISIYEQCTHTLKSTSHIVGAFSIYEQILAVRVSLEAGKIPEEEKHKHLLDILLEHQKNIPFVKKELQNNKQKIDINPTHYAMDINSIMEKIKRYEPISPKETNALLEFYNEKNKPSNTELIKFYLNNYNYDAVIEILNNEQ